MEKKDTRHVLGNVANNLVDDEIRTIIATMEFFGVSELFQQQCEHDLTVPRFRVFDWICMLLDGRCTGYPDGGEANNKLATKVIAHSFLKSEGDVDKFIADLRYSDYELDRSYERIEWIEE